MKCMEVVKVSGSAICGDALTWEVRLHIKRRLSRSDHNENFDFAKINLVYEVK